MLAPLDTCVSPMLTLDEVTTDPHWLARGSFCAFEHPEHGVTRQVRPFGNGSGADRGPAPARGASDSEAVLSDCGLTPPEIAALRTEGAIQWHPRGAPTVATSGFSLT